MKICFFCNNIFSLGGVQRVVSVISNELTKFYEVDVICTSNKYKEDRNIYGLNNKVNVKFSENISESNLINKTTRVLLRNLNNKTGIFDNKKNIELLTKIYYPNIMQEYWIKYFNNSDYDVIIAVEEYYSIFLGIIDGRLNKNTKTIGWQHISYDSYIYKKSNVYPNQETLFNEYIKKLDKYIVLNEYDKEKFFENNKITCEYIYNPKSFKSEIKSNLKSNKFLALGRFSYVKGFDMLIESFNLFAKKNKNWELIILGDGEERENILNLISKYKLNERIKVEPFTDDVKKYFIDSSTLLLSSRNEGMPMVVLEAQELGLPTIAYNISAIRPLVTNGVEGIVINKFDIVAFSKAMEEIAESYHRRRIMGENALNKSKEFELENIIINWKDLLENLNN